MSCVLDPEETLLTARWKKAQRRVRLFRWLPPYNHPTPHDASSNDLPSSSCSLPASFIGVIAVTFLFRSGLSATVSSSPGDVRSISSSLRRCELRLGVKVDSFFLQPHCHPHCYDSFYWFPSWYLFLLQRHDIQLPCVNHMFDMRLPHVYLMSPMLSSFLLITMWLPWPFPFTPTCSFTIY